MVMIDCGLSFSNDNGAKFLLPNLDFFTDQNIDMLKAILCTHGHKDHIGALPYLLKN